MTVVPLYAPNAGWRRARPRRGRLGRLAGRLFTAVRDRRKRMRDRNELAALDDQTLRDIGLTRGDIDYLASKAAERDAFYESLRFPPF